MARNPAEGIDSFGSARLAALRLPPAITRRLTSAAVWAVAGAFVARALGLLSSIIIARILGKDSFGQYGIIQSTVGLFSVFAGFGLGITATKFVAEYKHGEPARAGRILALSEIVAAAVGLGVALCLVVGAPWLASQTLAAPALTSPLRISALVVLFGAMDGALTGALVGLEAFRRLAIVTLASGVVTFMTTVAGLYIGGLTGAVWGLGLGTAAMWLLDHIAVRQEARLAHIKISARGALQELPILWHFSLPAMLGAGMIVPINWYCSAYLVNRPSGYSEMGAYNAANQWRTAILFFPMRLAAIVLPLLASTRRGVDSPHYSRILWLNVGISTAAALLPALGVAILSQSIMGAYGKGFASSYQVLVVLALSTVPMIANHVMGASVASLDRMWYGLMANLAWAVVMVVSTHLLVPEKGALGLAIATLVAVPFQTVCLAAFCIRNVPETNRD